jgi:hypothetical protein
MKKIILASVLAVASVSAIAAAASVCNGTAGSGTGISSAATNFIKVAFTPKCSANVHLAYEEGGTYFRVGSTNTKGARAWMGSTAGSSVASTSCASTSACVASDATAATTNASNPTS